MSLNKVMPLPSATPELKQLVLNIQQAPIYNVVKKTPLKSMQKLSERTGCRIWLKREDLQPVHSFKLRGAYNKLLNLSQRQKAAGVIAASAGNHAQGVALAAKKLGIDATIIMPLTTPKIKVDAVKYYNAKVKLVGDSFDEAKQHAEQLAEQQNTISIPPYDDLQVIAGQGTIAMELLQQHNKLDMVFVPVGGGGLIAGVAAYIKMIQPDVKIIGVEAEDSACFQAALETGKPVELKQVGLFADGVAVKKIGTHTFRIAQTCVDEVIHVSNDEICAAIQDIFNDSRAIAEPAGALAIAGLKKYQQQNKLVGLDLAAILSGANINFHSLRYVSETCELGEGNEAVLAVTIAEKKGSFRQFCRMLKGRMITEFNYRFTDPLTANIFVGLRLSDQEDDKQQLIQKLRHQELTVTDFTDNELAKIHIRYMVGGSSSHQLTEQIISFQFPETPGALMKFLDTLGELWNITLFHYRNHGAAYGQVLAGFEVPDSEQLKFKSHLKQLGYHYIDESHNPAYQQFLT